MAQLFGLSAEQVDGIRPFFPQGTWCETGGRPQGVERHHPCHVEGSALGGCPGRLWPPQNPLQPFRHWSDKGVFALIFSELPASDAPEPPDAPEPEVLMVDATDITAHPTASSLNKGVPPPD